MPCGPGGMKPGGGPMPGAGCPLAAGAPCGGGIIEPWPFAWGGPPPIAGGGPPGIMEPLAMNGAGGGGAPKAGGGAMPCPPMEGGPLGGPPAWCGMCPGGGPPPPPAAAAGGAPPKGGPPKGGPKAGRAAPGGPCAGRRPSRGQRPECVRQVAGVEGMGLRGWGARPAAGPTCGGGPPRPICCSCALGGAPGAPPAGGIIGLAPYMPGAPAGGGIPPGPGGGKPPGPGGGPGGPWPWPGKGAPGMGGLANGGAPPAGTGHWASGRGVTYFATLLQRRRPGWPDRAPFSEGQVRQRRDGGGVQHAGHAWLEASINARPRDHAGWRPPCSARSALGVDPGCDIPACSPGGAPGGGNISPSWPEVISSDVLRTRAPAALRPSNRSSCTKQTSCRRARQTKWDADVPPRRVQYHTRDRAIVFYRRVLGYGLLFQSATSDRAHSAFAAHHVTRVSCWVGTWSRPRAPSGSGCGRVPHQPASNHRPAGSSPSACASPPAAAQHPTPAAPAPGPWRSSGTWPGRRCPRPARAAACRPGRQAESHQSQGQARRVSCNIQESIQARLFD
jgi:hypothetical protein